MNNNSDEVEPKFIESTTAVIKEDILEGEELIEISDPENPDGIIAAFVIPLESSSTLVIDINEKNPLVSDVEFKKIMDGVNKAWTK